MNHYLTYIVSTHAYLPSYSYNYITLIAFALSQAQIVTLHFLLIVV